MLKEFKNFIARGSVIDMAVGVIIGAAFTAIVTSLVNNMINPLIGIFMGKVNFSDLVFKVGAATFKYGEFINSIISFLIIAFVVFLMVKFLNQVIKKNSKEPAKPTSTEILLKEIRDELRKDKSIG